MSKSQFNSGSEVRAKINWCYFILFVAATCNAHTLPFSVLLGNAFG
ncbi:MAG TPA: hypothetical protein VH415_02040 [Nitrososphaeraceae archaeon]